MKLNKLQNNRSCNGCTKCCEGWLTTKVFEHDLYIGRPCHFVTSDGCGIYKKRPKNPCKIFKCQWLINPDIPEWLYPKKSEVIIIKRNIKNLFYFEIREAGKKLSVEILNWIILKHINDHINVAYSINGGKNLIGSKEFIELMKNETK